MLQPLSLEQLKHELRVAVCPTCRFRPTPELPGFPIAGSSCESACPIFNQLAGLREQALCVDPMFSRVRALTTRIKQINREAAGDSEPVATPMTEYGEKVARLVARACDC